VVTEGIWTALPSPPKRGRSHREAGLIGAARAHPGHQQWDHVYKDALLVEEGVFIRTGR
jgi:hypothetical protein